MMRKLFALILTLGLLFALCACGAKNDDNINTGASIGESTADTIEGQTTEPTTEPAACNHEWQAATCVMPRICTKCGKAQGHNLGHKWNEATCTEPQSCTVCGVTNGETAEHDFQNGKCTVCGEAAPE